MPARQAFVIEMIEERDDLGNAIALNSSMVNGAKLIGPAIAGVLVATAGAGVCFLIDGLSYIAVIYSLLAMRVAPGTAAPCRRKAPCKNWRKGGNMWWSRQPSARSCCYSR